MKVVVTGSSGQLGSYLVEHFAQKHEVVALDSRPSTLPEVAKRTKLVDISRVRELKEHLKDADWLIHSAAQVSVEKSLKDPLFDAENNVLGTVNLLWNCFLHEVQHFLYISSAAVYGNPLQVPIDEGHPTDPMSPYGASKLCGEKYSIAFAEAYGLSVSIIRPFNIYSPRADPESPYSGVITKFVNWAKAGRPLVIEGDGLQTRDFVHASDVVRMIDLMVRKGTRSVGRIFNCGTGQARSIRELAELVVSLSPKKAELQFAAPRAGDIKHSCADIRRAEELLGYFPKAELAKGLEEMLS